MRFQYEFYLFFEKSLEYPLAIRSQPCYNAAMLLFHSPLHSLCLCWGVEEKIWPGAYQSEPKRIVMVSLTIALTLVLFYQLFGPPEPERGFYFGAL